MHFVSLPAAALHSLPFFPVLLSPLFTSPLWVSATKSSYNGSGERFELPQQVWTGDGSFSAENHAFGDKINLPTLICVKTEFLIYIVRK